MRRANLVETVLAEARSDAVLAAGQTCVVAVSGGADSTALLHSLVRASSGLGLTITAAHLDHGIRAESPADAARVAELCAALDVELDSGRVTLKNNSEEAARNARHRFLARAAQKRGAKTVAYGHTADDQAETVLLHLLRGSGIAGLRGMRVREGLRFRPLLHVTREEVLAHCLRHDLQYVDDPSNAEPRYLRNRVRHELLPLMRLLNPSVRVALTRLADAAAQAQAVIESEAAAWLLGSTRELSRAGFAKLPDAVAFDVLRQAWQAAVPEPLDGASPTPTGGSARLAEAVKALAVGAAGEVDLGRGVRLVYGSATFRVEARVGEIRGAGS